MGDGRTNAVKCKDDDGGLYTRLDIRIRRAETVDPPFAVIEFPMPSSCSHHRLRTYRGERCMRTSCGDRCMRMSRRERCIRISCSKRCVRLSRSERCMRTSCGERRRIGLGCHGCQSGWSGSHDCSGLMARTATLQIWVTASNVKDNIVVVAVCY